MNLILTLELAMKIEQGTSISLNKLFTALCQGNKDHRGRLESPLQRVG